MCTIGWGSLPMAFIHGAPGFHVFSSSVYNYLAGIKINDIVVGGEIGDPIIKMITSEVITSASDTV